MSAWKKLAAIVEATTKMPPPTPGSTKKPPSVYLPGIHNPSSPVRKPKGIKQEEPDEAKVNWGKFDKKRNMDRWGAISGREHDRQRSRLQAPDSVFADYDRQQALKRMKPPGEIPSGADRPSQSNPLMTPSAAGPQAKPRPGWEDVFGLEPADDSSED